MSDPYNAKNDGTGDQTAAIQNSISYTSSIGGDRKDSGVTTQPAQVYIPSGTYVLGSTLNLLTKTIFMGDPNDPPVLRAGPDFNGETLINGNDDSSGHHETPFFTQLRNVVLDITAIDSFTSITALQWGVAQSCAVGNLKIRMPLKTTGHSGINLEGGSTIAVTDVQITDGAIGIQNSNQQVNVSTRALLHSISCSYS